MRVEKSSNGFVIVRGLKSRTYLSFIADGHLSWSKHKYAARLFRNTKPAQEIIDWIRTPRREGGSR